MVITTQDITWKPYGVGHVEIGFSGKVTIDGKICVPIELRKDMDFNENEYVQVYIKRSSGEGEAFFPALITHSIIVAGKMLIPVHIRKQLELQHGEYLEVKIRRFNLEFEVPET